MNTLAAFLEGLGRVSLQGAILVLLVLLAQRLLATHLAPRWRCALWLVVMARLVLPVSVSSVASIFNAMPKLNSTESRIPSSFKRVEPVADLSDSIEINRIEPVSNPDPIREFQARPKSFNETSTPKSIRWPATVFALWLAGALTLASYITIGSVRMTRRFSALSQIHDAGLLALLEQCRQAHALRSRLSLAESADVTTPALYGFFRPKLLLPPGIAARFSASEMRFILLHEIAHIKRRDIAFNWLASLLQIVHWFNPLVWFGFSRWRADRELACDAMALDAAGPEQNREYGQTILRWLEGFSPRAALPGLVGILEDKKQLRRRIAMIADYAPRRKWQILALLLVAALAITGLTDAQDKTSHPEKSKETKAEKSAAAQFLKIAAEIEFIRYRLGDTNAQAVAKPQVISSVCITGPGKWRIEDDSVQAGEEKWFFDGTNVFNRLLHTICIWPSCDGLPLGSASENMPWLAFCSGAYLKREGRIIPLPLDILRHTRDRFAYSDKTTTFDDELGLPQTVDMFTSRSLYQASEDDFDKEYFFGGRYTEWTKKTAAGLQEGVLTFHYAVTESTNFLGHTLPTKFEFFQNGRRYEQNGDWFFSGIGRVKSISSSDEPQGVFEPGSQQTIVDGRFRDAAYQVDSIIYTTTNGFASPTNDPFLQAKFKEHLEESEMAMPIPTSSR